MNSKYETEIFNEQNQWRHYLMGNVIPRIPDSDRDKAVKNRLRIFHFEEPDENERFTFKDFLSTMNNAR